MNQEKAPWYFLLLLILAGESIFILPYVLSRVFRPTVLEVFGLDNVQLGICFSVYGIVALVSYLFGGPTADKYPPRKLIAVALWMTALGGLVYATFPSYTVLKILYGYWGFTTIFLFWPALIKATRVWGGSSSQGKAFGFLDGGRGLVGALFGTMGILTFSLFISSEISEVSVSESRAAFKYVILISTAAIALVGLMVWLFMKIDYKSEKDIIIDKIAIPQIKEVLRLPSVWLLMIIILCAYVGYKVTDVFSLYAQDVMLYDQVKSAQVGTFLLFIRPVIGILNWSYIRPFTNHTMVGAKFCDFICWGIVICNRYHFRFDHIFIFCFDFNCGNRSICSTFFIFCCHGERSNSFGFDRNSSRDYFTCRIYTRYIRRSCNGLSFR